MCDVLTKGKNKLFIEQVFKFSISIFHKKTHFFKKKSLKKVKLMILNKFIFSQRRGF